MRTTSKPPETDLRSVSGTIINAIERDAAAELGTTIWSLDGATPERANGYTPNGAVHVLEARDHTLWRLTIEQVETTNASEVVPTLRSMLHTKPTGWYVADGVRVIAGPFDNQADAEALRRRITGERTAAAYKYPDGAPMPIWTATTYYWPGDAAA